MQFKNTLLMMSFFIVLLSGCGAKYPPSALFPTSPTNIDQEIKNRNPPASKENQDKETTHEPN